MKTATYLNARCKEILDLLVTANEHMSVEDIARIRMVSRRSVYYDLCKINEWMEYNSLPPVEAERGKGIYLTADQRNQIARLSDRTDSMTGYVLSPSERIYVLICLVGNSVNILRIEELSGFCQVSRNTVINDLKAAASLLSRFDLKLCYKPASGYYVEGEAIRRRSVCLYCFYQVSSLYTSGILRFYGRDRAEVQDSLERLAAVARALDTSYTEEVQFSMVQMFPVMRQGTDSLKFKDFYVSGVLESREFQLVEEYFPEFSSNERVYLAIHLLGNRGALWDTKENDDLYGVACALVSEFERIAGIRFASDSEVERAVFVHLKTVWPRILYGIRIDGAPLIQDLVRANIDLFEVTRKACAYLEHELALPVADSEIACLALNFAGYIEQSANTDDKLRVLVVCRLGTVAGYMLSWEIRAMLSHVQIIGVVAHQDVFNVKDVCDLVVSTVPVKSDVQVVVVHPIMTDREKLTLMNIGTKIVLDRRQAGPDMACEEILEIVKQYVPKGRWDGLRDELTDYFEHKRQVRLKLDISKSQGLLYHLTEDRICLADKEMSWGEALRLVGKPLIQDKSIEPQYVETIEELIRTMGTYMFFVPWLILAHAKPDAGVNRLSVSMGIFKEPVMFSQYRQAKIILMLAPVDKESHMEILKDIMTIFAVQSRINDLQHQESAYAVIELLKKYCL